MTTELTPRDDNRKRVSEILKRVDQLIKSREYEQAQRETERAKEIDPRNVYIDAYQERINVLIEQAAKERVAQEARQREEEAAHKKFEEERQKQEAERQRRLAEERKRQEEEQHRKKIEDEIVRKKVEEELRQKKEEEEIRRRLEEARRKQAPHHTHADHLVGGGIAKVFVIDDDEKLLNVLKGTIEESDFEVFAFTTSDDAYKALKEATPDLIVSDINLETSTMGGFSFYEKVRELDHLQEVPFVFLSGLSDDVLIRTGKELGIDDYITKPFSDKHLLAVIKGKIKRYRQLKSHRS